MSTYPISCVFASDRSALAAVDSLLASEGICRDAHLDYTCAVFEEGRAIATGSCFGNTLRCMAVAKDHQGEHLMNEIVTHLMDVESQRGIYRLFLYTKCRSAKVFASLGFHEVARAEGQAVFMENRSDGFPNYLASLKRMRIEAKRSSAIVMNANPFTNGHLHLIQTAARTSDIVHLFILSEDASIFPFAVRKNLVQEGIADIPNVVIHDSGPYIISMSTFPSYFLGDDLSVARSHAELDVSIFCRIAKALGITERFCGQERPGSVTAIYNDVMAHELPAAGIRFSVIPRITANGSKATDGSKRQPVSASTVRRLLKEGNLEAVRELVPPSTYAYLSSAKAEPVLARIRATKDLVHH